MSLHLPLPKICTIGRWVYTFPCQNFALFVSPLKIPVSPFLNGRHCGAEIRNEFILSVAKKCLLFLPTWREPRDDWSKNQIKSCPCAQSYYRKRGSASYIVREVRSVRERYREGERERERDGSDVTLLALNLAMNLAPFLAKKFHLSIGEEFCTFSCQNFAP